MKRIVECRTPSGVMVDVDLKEYVKAESGHLLASVLTAEDPDRAAPLADANGCTPEELWRVQSWTLRVYLRIWVREVERLANDLLEEQTASAFTTALQMDYKRVTRLDPELKPWRKDVSITKEVERHTVAPDMARFIPVVKKFIVTTIDRINEH